MKPKSEEKKLKKMRMEALEFLKEVEDGEKRKWKTKRAKDLKTVVRKWKKKRKRSQPSEVWHLCYLVLKLQ